MTTDAHGNIHLPAGVTGAGQFNGRVNTAPAGALVLDAPEGARDEHQWGKTTVRVGSRTPWGPADWVDETTPGIAQVSTASHGGVKLSPERQNRMPPALRVSGAWYEEDVEASLVAAVWPESFLPANATAQEVEERRVHAENMIREWMPDRFEAWKGVTLGPGESRVRDEERYRQEHRGDFLVRSATIAEAVPGMVRVSAVRESDGAEQWFLVPQAEYSEHRATVGDGTYPFPVDPSRHPRLPEAAPQERARPVPVTQLPDLTGRTLTAAARARIEADLGKMWGFPEGPMTLGEFVERNGLTGRTIYVDGTRREYRVHSDHGDSSRRYSFKVSKATWEAFDGIVPDDRSPAEIAHQEWYLAQEKFNKDYAAIDTRDMAGFLKRQQEAKAKLDELKAAHQELWEAERQAARERAAARQLSWAERERAARVEGQA